MPLQTTLAPGSIQRASIRTLVLVCLAPVLLLAATAYVAHWKEIGIEWMLRDPSALGRLPFYAGFITKIGVVLWVITASVSLFGYAVLEPSLRGADAARFLLASGTMSAILGVDDFFMFHETIAPRGLGVPEKFVLASYVLLIAGIVLRLRQFVLSVVDGLLVGALACFAGSLAVDLFWGSRPYARYYLLEDGLKFVGITLWTAFHLRLTLGLLRPLLVPAPRSY